MVNPSSNFDPDPTTQQLNSTPSIKLPKVNNIIEYKIKESDNWTSARVISRGGKSTGKHKACMNIENVVDKSKLCVNFDEIFDFKIKNDIEEANVVTVPPHRHDEQNVKDAKNLELDNWKKFNVYIQVKDTGQKAITTTRVITEKRINNHISTKARLVARGFEEEQCLQVDSPTAHKTTL